MTSGDYGGIGALVGGAIGFSLGGPAGVAAGMRWGATIGTVLDALTAKPQPSPGDARWSGVTYGTGRNRVWVRGRVNGQIIWAAKNAQGTYLNEHDASIGASGGSSGGGTAAHYHASFAVHVCDTGFTFPDDSQIERKIVIDRIWMMDKVVYQSATAVPVAAWSNATTYAFGDPVTGSDSKIYTSLADGNLNHDPVSSPTYWQLAELNHNVNISIHPTDLESTFTMAADTFIQSVDGAANTPAYRGMTYFVVQDMDLFDIGNQIPWSSVVVECHTDALLDSDCFSDICRLSGLLPAEFDFSSANNALEGKYMQTRGTGQSWISDMFLLKAYDVTQIDGVIKTVPRGGASVMTIPPGDMACVLNSVEERPDAVEADLLADTGELHSSVVVKFFNQLDSFRYGGERAVRNVSRFSNPLDIDSGLTLTPDNAAKMAGRLLDTEWLEAGSKFTISLPTGAGASYGALCATDPITFYWNGKNRRFRITRIEFQLGLIKVEAVRDEIAVLTRYETGSSAVSTTTSIVPYAQPTWFRVASPNIDIDDARASYPGFYVFATGNVVSNGLVKGWDSADVWYTFDAPGGSRSWQKAGSVTVSSVIGQVYNHAGVSPLPDSSTTGYETADSTYLKPDVLIAGFLSALTLAQVQGGMQVGLVGLQEWIGIVTAQTPIVWPSTVDHVQQIGTGLIRCYRGSNGTGHALGEQVCVSPSVSQTAKFAIDASYVGQTVYVQCCQPGQTAGSYPEHSCVIAAPTKPYVSNDPPVDPSAISSSAISYVGQGEVVRFAAAYAATPPGSQRLQWEYSTDAGSTFSALTLGDSTYTPPSFTSGPMRVRARAIVADGRVGNWVSSSDVTYAAPATPEPSPVAATTILASNPSYSGATETLVFTPETNSAPPGQRWEWQSSTDGSSWTSSVFGPTFPVSFSVGNIYARVRGVTNAGNSSWVQTGPIAYASPPTVISSSGWTRQYLTGDGVTTAFTLTHAPIANSESINVGKVLQKYTDDYTISGTTLTFGAAPDNGAEIVAQYPS